MICPRCQSPQVDGVKFCASCGSPMPVSGQTPPPQPQSQYGAPQSAYGAPPQQPQYGAQPQQPQYGGPQPSNAPDGGYIPPNQYEEYSNSPFGSAVPKAELHNPKGPL